MFPPAGFIADAHEDLGYHCQEYGRSLTSAQGCLVPVMITLPMLQEANVRLVCATLFVAHEKPERERRYMLHSQYELYRQWLEAYSLELTLVQSGQQLAALRGTPEAEGIGKPSTPIALIMLMEGLDLLESPAELETWFNRGVRVASLTWNGRNRYASGCFSDNGGITPQGKDMLAEFERLGMILDLSHLSDSGIEDALGNYSGPVCSTHSNSRAVSNHQRNLTDGQATEISRRGGVIGLNLLAPLVMEGWKRGDPEPPLSIAARHVDYLSQIVSRDSVGLGSDLDGGLTPDNTPEGINDIRDLRLLEAELKALGWDQDGINGFMGTNWWRYFQSNLPD